MNYSSKRLAAKILRKRQKTQKCVVQPSPQMTPNLGHSRRKLMHSTQVEDDQPSPHQLVSFSSLRDLCGTFENDKSDLPVSDINIKSENGGFDIDVAIKDEKNYPSEKGENVMIQHIMPLHDAISSQLPGEECHDQIEDTVMLSKPRYGVPPIEIQPTGDIKLSTPQRDTSKSSRSEVLSEVGNPGCSNGTNLNSSPGDYFKQDDPSFPCEDLISECPIRLNCVPPTGETVDINSNAVNILSAVTSIKQEEGLDETVTSIKQESDVIVELTAEEEIEVQSEISQLLSGNIKGGRFSSLRDLAKSFTKPTKKRRKRRTLSDANEIHQCTKCPYTSKCKGDFSKHSKYVHGGSDYSCPVENCQFTTKFPNNIKHHMMCHSDKKPHACSVCRAAFKRKNQLQTHMLVHSDDRPAKCPHCSFSAKRNWVLTCHIGSKHSDERKFECDICGVRMKMRNDLMKHRKSHIQERNCLCTKCGKSFKNKVCLKRHQMHMHEGKKASIPCTYKGCESIFRFKKGLDNHIKAVHQCIRNFECDICQRKFFSSCNLKSHMVTHDAITRPYMCPICPYRGQERDHVFAHIGSMHSTMRLYNCTICHSRFRHPGQLRQHLNTERHRRNMKFALPPADTEVCVDEENLENNDFIEYPVIKIVDDGMAMKTEQPVMEIEQPVMKIEQPEDDNKLKVKIEQPEDDNKLKVKIEQPEDNNLEV